MEINLESRCSTGARAVKTGTDWHLEIPAGEGGNYRLSQLDDYTSLSRRRFPHTPPFTLNLRARASAQDLHGTWGFGLWNDPFGFSLGLGGSPGRLPTLPSAAWFFYASAPNWLSLQNNMPGQGFFAGTYHPAINSTLLLMPALPVLPLLNIRPISRVVRRVAGKIIHQDMTAIEKNVTLWHKYSIAWFRAHVRFAVDDETVLETPLTPTPPLGLVIWIDNQYASWTMDGRLKLGTLENSGASLDINILEQD